MQNHLIVHLTSVHRRHDVRIFSKECRSLVKCDYKVILVVADGAGDAQKDSVSIFDVGKCSSRLTRILKLSIKLYQKALALNADIYHLHDPELIPLGFKLLKKGKKVIFDAHEDLPKQIYSKPYLKTWIKPLVSWLVKQMEKRLCRNFDAIVAATPAIRDKFIEINNKTTDINNYPILSELYDESDGSTDKKKAVCYVGGITRERGILQVVKALSLLQQKGIEFHLIGRYTDEHTHKEAMAMEGYKLINEHGFQKRERVKELLQESMAGIVTFLPFPNHIEAQPNKMFEYMSAGIPVIASHFPLWREIVEGNQCGICVNPENPEEIANAIEYIVNHPVEAGRMGQNGRRAVEQKYNWDTEEKKLLDLYSQLLDK